MINELPQRFGHRLGKGQFAVRGPQVHMGSQEAFCRQSFFQEFGLEGYEVFESEPAFVVEKLVQGTTQRHIADTGPVV